MNLARETVAKAWCKVKTAHKVFDHDLAEEFAIILNDIWSKPWLGNATTRELLDELKARAEVNGTLDYKTVKEHT